MRLTLKGRRVKASSVFGSGADRIERRCAAGPAVIDRGTMGLNLELDKCNRESIVLKDGRQLYFDGNLFSDKLSLY